MTHERLDTRIDRELDRLCWSIDTSPDDTRTLVCWNCELTAQHGIVTLHTPQEVTLFHGPELLDTLRALPEGTRGTASGRPLCGIRCAKSHHPSSTASSAMMRGSAGTPHAWEARTTSTTRRRRHTP